ncbi:hydroxymethylbilane synthase [Sandaracinobacteroides saxicola]|uniref:Porphobilinogen deaminase n=1 Tax=Sandaracinobacteroides saxicola TaxID=2759707 RepID=A0A7G5IL91_9SPHN|nr:hydroxymethylbilane synthase [Sandaracinobacteroides saxicola]QMW24133.1 hydroxymethylbilane synthase [Sandaracinobacteroides saxicola]
MLNGQPLRLGTRGSPLALAQTRMVAAALTEAHGWPAGTIETVTVSTLGDRVQDRPLADIGGKALWTKELDGALLEGRIDAAVHSMKDVESLLAPGITLAAFLPRADPRDRLLGADSLAALPPGARVGTSSPRRRAQLLHARPDLDVVILRGNVATRMAKVAGGEIHATLLAAAGLDRLGHPDGTALPLDTWLPAVAQGAIGITARADDTALLTALAAIDHADTRRAVEAERAFLVALDGNCHSPVAVHAHQHNGWVLDAELYDTDGTTRVADRLALTPRADIAAFAHALLARAPASIRTLFAA